jgi:exopolysaccharide biosynthesis polyprenyl glycosylphosphotransferase
MVKCQSAAGIAMNDLNNVKDFRLVSPNVGVDLLLDRADNWNWDNASLVTRHSGLALPFADGVPVLSPAGPERRIALRGKRAFDILAALAALFMLLPLMMIVALLIKLTSNGPVLFSQQREGLHGKSFALLKFRSMRTDACDVSGVTQTVRDDPRVTWIGRFIRKTSIDELPQLFNVLRGDMSLVGPRPHVPGMKSAGVLYRELVPYYDLRLLMLPGLTGWAQANGLRGETTNARLARARIDHDIAYIRHFSLWLDIKIILKTIQNEFVGGSGL